MTLSNNLLSIRRVYDQRYQLTENAAGSIMNYEYTHDPAGDILSISGVTDATPLGGTTNYTHQGNRLDAATGHEPGQYSYDDNGNIISDGTQTFTYNQNNRLIQVEQGAVTLGEYAYDGLGRRVKKTVSGTITHFHYDQAGNLIAETNVDGTPLRDIIYQDGERVAMEIYGAQAGTYYFLNDHLGTPRSVIDESGQIVWQAAYPPFGKAQVLTETIVNNFRLPGQYFGAETGLHYNYFRYYDPSTGRYLTPDPIGLEGGINLFIYALNNPVNLVDPLGLRYWSNVWNNFKVTNTSIPGVLAPTGMGIITAGHTAEAIGTTTLLSWAGSGFSGASLSGATFTGLETGVLVGGTAVTNFALTGAIWEVGVGIGSLVSGIPVYGTDQSIGSWWGDFFFDLIHGKETSSDPCS